MRHHVWLVVLLAIAVPLMVVRTCQQPLAERPASAAPGEPFVGGFTPSVSTHPESPTPAATATLAPPEATIRPLATPSPVPTLRTDVSATFDGVVTHYGESYNGQTMGCGGTYSSDDLGIAAVAYPSRNAEWPCGTAFLVEGPTGSLWVSRTDSCPGCGANHLDLSESGMLAVCGYLGRCQVRITPVLR